MSLISWKKKFLFWQPKTDWFKKISKYKFGNYFLVFINYIIWVFLFFVSYFLIKHKTNIFWQLFTSTLIGEIIEKFLKIQPLWRRPLHLGNNTLPNGLLKSWYKKGSFPSGHAMKATFFLLFVLQYSGVVNPYVFTVITVPLVLIRIFLGLHYPIDVLGGIIFGLLIWVPVHFLIFPDFLINLVAVIFNFVFFIK
ncbi:MAG: phosphatase PAP2 family protein [Candidatus Shapirobacteria bacterium]|nr:phosphatase PAP2 family protein [Candidatus Shapirobacteria bacterium]MDD3002404.1 phosphatase PAP2 family protein [Candidatus Shapirobacteria bacterium]MDD4383288.1 phosphatase PAP2 family protein [Candidatus Shapirobacteria bacterium]